MDKNEIQHWKAMNTKATDYEFLRPWFEQRGLSFDEWDTAHKEYNKLHATEYTSSISISSPVVCNKEEHFKVSSPTIKHNLSHWIKGRELRRWRDYNAKKISGQLWYPEEDIKRPVKRHYLKPWKDPESLFCDTEFLEKLLRKKIRKGDECKDKE